MQDKAFAHDLLGMYLGELEDYIRQIPEIVGAKNVNAYRFLNHKVKSMINTLEAVPVLEAQAELQRHLTKGTVEQINTAQQQLMDLIHQLIKILEERKRYYAQFNNQLA